jgi:hypothetical protein
MNLRVRGPVADHGGQALIIRHWLVIGFWRQRAAGSGRKKFSPALLKAGERAGVNAVMGDLARLSLAVSRKLVAWPRSRPWLASVAPRASRAGLACLSYTAVAASSDSRMSLGRAAVACRVTCVVSR